jgi:hypothetical protein
MLTANGATVLFNGHVAAEFGRMKSIVNLHFEPVFAIADLSSLTAVQTPDRSKSFHFHLDGSSLAKLYSLGSIASVSATFVEPWRGP